MGIDKTVNDASLTWNNELGRIVVEGGTQEQKITFYTALYYAFWPKFYMDVDGKYRGRDLQVHQAKGFGYYTVFSLWDTYRAEHPLYVDRAES